MFRCPRCQVGLTRQKAESLVAWGCARCRGRAVALTTLRERLSRWFVHELWTDTRDRPGDPACQAPQTGLAVAMIGVGAVGLMASGLVGLGVGFGVLFLGAQLAYCQHYRRSRWAPP